MSDEHWFTSTYDQYVAGETSSPTPLEKSIDAVAHLYVDAVESGLIPRRQTSLFEEGKQLTERYIRPARDRRRNAMRKSIERVRDALTGDTVLGADDPMLTQAYPLGDGTDKTLGYWTQDDYRNATTERYRNAAAATAAAKAFDDLAAEIASAMQERAAATTADLLRRADS